MHIVDVIQEKGKEATSERPIVTFTNVYLSTLKVDQSPKFLYTCTRQQFYHSYTNSFYSDP